MKVNSFRRVAQIPQRLARRVALESARRLPCNSKTFGPPRGVAASTEEWAKQYPGATFHLLELLQNAVCPPPLALEDLPDAYCSQLKAKTTARFVIEIPQGRVCRGGLVLTPDDFVLGDLTYQSKLPAFQNQKLPIFSEVKLPVRRVDGGRVAVLSSLWADNYYHWLYDVVPRLHLLRRCEIEIDRYVVPHDLPFQKQTLELLGIPLERCIADEARLHLEAELLIVPSLPGGQGNPPRWILEFLHQTLTAHLSDSPLQSTPKRIYISRADAHSRRVENEAQVMEILAPLGFESVTLDGLSVGNQIQLFYEADAVVASHGAALSNLAFCRPETRVIELFAPRWIYPVYNFVGAHSNLRMACLVGQGERPLEDNNAKHQGSDISVDLDQLELMLRKLDFDL